MQRRVAFAYLAFFLVMGASAYSVIAVADAPEVRVEGETLETGSVVQVEGRQYTVSNLSVSGGGEGGSASYAGTLTYTNDSAVFTETIEHNATVEFRNASYLVRIPNASSPGSFRLVEQLDAEAILANDSAVDDQVYTDDDGTEFVRYENGETQPLAEYLPEPETAEFAVGDEIQYQGRTMTVAALTREAATLEYVSSRTVEIGLAQGENVTLGDTQYFANFHGDSDNVRVTLATTEAQYDTYVREVERQDYFHERMNGLWGVVILSGLAGASVVSLALLPIKG
jgi:uncharacterized Zn finger protein